MRGSSRRRATVGGALVLCCTLACIPAANPLPSFAPRRPFVPHLASAAAPRPFESTLALRGGSSDEGEEQPSQQQQENGAAPVDEEELSIEDEQDEEIAPEILDGDAVSVSAAAFIHPAHVEDDVDVEDVELAEDIETTADVVANCDDAFYPAAEDEDEGSTTPVTPDDDDDDVDDDDASTMLAQEEGPVDDHVYDDGAVVGEEDEEEEEGKEEPVVPAVEEEEHVAAQETDETKLQSGSTFTDDESAAYVDRMDLADDEGEAPIVEVETEAVVPAVTDEDAINDDDDNNLSSPLEAAAHSITDAIADVEEDDMDPLDLSEVQSTREALERERQATVAAATQTARGASASTAQGVTSVQYMITRKMRNLLIDELGYTDAEVDNMKPDVAAVLTSKRLKRPSSGMPDAFYVDGKAPSPKKNPLRDIMKIILPAVGIGLSALLTANAIQHSSIGSTTISTKQKVAVSPPITPVPGEQVEDLSNEEKKKRESANSLGSSPVATTGIVGDEQLNEAAALKTGPQALPKDLNDSWVDRATSRLLEAFRFRR